LFDEDPESLTGALLREQWITEKLLEALWDRLPEEAKREIAKKTEELLKRAGVDPASAGRAAGGLLTGGFSAARLVLGFRFHILLAQLANLLIPSLSLATNAALQRFAGLLFVRGDGSSPSCSWSLLLSDGSFLENWTSTFPQSLS
jgi:hypothetical protein